MRIDYSAGRVGSRAYKVGSILDWLRSSRRVLIIASAMILTRTATTLVLPASSKVLIDEVVVAGRHTLLAPLTFVVCVAALLQASLGLSIDYLLSRSSTLLVAGFRIRLVEHLLRLPIGYFDSQRDGSIASRVMNDADAVRHFAGSGAAECAGGIVTALAVLVMLCTLSLRLTALIFAVCIVFATAVWICARKAKTCTTSLRP